MELVIKVPEEMWEKVKKGYVPLGIGKHLMNGKPLSEGHGRLVDASRLEQHINQKLLRYAMFPQYTQGLTIALHDVIDIAPTIIEAGKTRDCNNCKYSHTEKCHECMQINKFVEADKAGSEDEKW